jgi:hypothetical protein
MGGSTLYDDDILLWSEQQAAAIRRLRDGPRRVPNDLDIENVAEEIESVGRSELAAVESHIELILVHLLKLLAAPESEPARHWRGELASFHSGLRRRFAPSMRSRIDMGALWSDARAQIEIGGDAAEQALIAELPGDCPLGLDDLLGPRLDLPTLERRLHEARSRDRHG